MAEQPRLVEDNSSLVKNDDDPVTSTHVNDRNERIRTWK